MQALLEEATAAGARAALAAASASASPAPQAVPVAATLESTGIGGPHSGTYEAASLVCFFEVSDGHDFTMEVPGEQLARYSQTDPALQRLQQAHHRRLFGAFLQTGVQSYLDRVKAYNKMATKELNAAAAAYNASHKLTKKAGTSLVLPAAGLVNWATEGNRARLAGANHALIVRPAGVTLNVDHAASDWDAAAEEYEGYTEGEEDEEAAADV